MKALVVSLVSAILLTLGLQALMLHFVKSGVNENLHKTALENRLFLHYLEGSEETVNSDFFSDKEIKAIKSLCDAQGPGVVSAYDTSLEDSLGKFSCLKAGAVDVYDFSYAPKRLTKAAFTDEFYAEVYLCNKEFSHHSDVGRCIVQKGFGKPFKIKIQF